MLRCWIAIISLCTFCLVFTNNTHSQTTDDTFAVRLNLFQQMSVMTGIPWTYLAAIDQYERSMTSVHREDRPVKDGLVAIYYSDDQWTGALNPDKEDRDPDSIAFFNGMGLDGNGDGLADRNSDEDVLYTMASHVLSSGTSVQDFRIGLWETYKNSRSVERIMQFVNIYSEFETLELEKHAFPLPLRADYSYRSTWGARRGWGGRRIHEGTDLFASYGYPVRSTCYGIVEIQGWNRYGGWRVGIRSINNVYHYYAHLSGFSKKLFLGKVVSPGETIGWVGSSGYGKPGTQGKFPPHLHYGLYRDAGYTDWSFDPYPYLLRWEREERQRIRSRK
jgi:hypothetical protein